MVNIENNTKAEPGSVEGRHTIADKKGLVVAFDQLSDEAKAQFYEDCKEGISLEDARKAMHQKIRQLWGK